MNYPVTFVPPCDELEMVVAHLHNELKAGRLTALPASYRADLNTLKAKCKTISRGIQWMLDAIEGLPDAPEGDQ